MQKRIVPSWERLDWFPDWSGQTAICLASGPSASYAAMLAALRLIGLKAPQDRPRCIAINESHRLAPWADALYAADYFWWLKHRGVPQFRGLKISQATEAADAFADINHIELGRLTDMIEDARGQRRAAPAANSGMQALNLAICFGARRILLVGYDMTIEYGFHWHGKHDGGSQNPTRSSIAKWCEALDQAAVRFSDASIAVINTSPISALKAFPVMALDEALGMTIYDGRPA